MLPGEKIAQDWGLTSYISTNDFFFSNLRAMYLYYCYQTINILWRDWHNYVMILVVIALLYVLYTFKCKWCKWAFCCENMPIFSFKGPIAPQKVLLLLLYKGRKIASFFLKLIKWWNWISLLLENSLDMSKMFVTNNPSILLQLQSL